MYAGDDAVRFADRNLQRGYCFVPPAAVEVPQYVGLAAVHDDWNLNVLVADSGNDEITLHSIGFAQHHHSGFIV